MTFQEYCQIVATEFIQNAVVIDDEAFSGAIRAEEQVDEMLTDSSRLNKIKTEPDPLAGETVHAPDASALVETDAERENLLNARELVDEFAEGGVFCSVIVPKAGETGRALKMAPRADIVILDWLIHRDGGNTALQIIRGIVTKDQDRLRLIVIYTGQAEEDELKATIDNILKNLEQTLPQRTFAKSGSFAITEKALRIVIYGKRHSVGESKGFEERLRSWRDLPNQAIQDFTKMCCGLVPAVALRALSAIRAHSWALLSAYSSGLDPAYLWHRASQSNPVDAEAQLLAMIIADMESIVSDEHAGQAAGTDAIKLWLLQQDNVDWGKRFGIDAVFGVNDLSTLLDTGAAKNNPPSKTFVDGLTLDKRRRKQVPFFREEPSFADTLTNMEHSNARFAMRSSLKALRPSVPPRLHLGTIVSEVGGEAKSYWICIQPLCDSERIGTTRGYPMLPLSAVSPDKRFDLVVDDGINLLHLQLRLLPFELTMVTFNAADSDENVTAKRKDQDYIFVSADDRLFYWVAEMKPAHASRVAQLFANKLARVGLDESEWLRLKAK